MRRLSLAVGDLGGEDPAVAVRGQCAANDAFGLALGVDVGRVDEVDAVFPSIADDAKRLRFIGSTAEHHGAETEARNGQAAASQAFELHPLWLLHLRWLRHIGLGTVQATLSWWAFFERGEELLSS